MWIPHAMKYVDHKALLAHQGWVRALARTLARDAAGAEDLEQETWSRALSARPKRGSDLRSWLGRIVRNTAREDWRGESRAQAARRSLAAGAKPGQELGALRAATETPAERQVRIETYRSLLTALTELEEPYGTVVYMRYVDELSIGEIAPLLGSPESTVRTQLRRGLERLRECVAGSLGDDWRARVLILAVPVAKNPLALLTSGGLALMSLKLTAAACAAVILAAYGMGAFDGAGQAADVAHDVAQTAGDLDRPLQVEVEEPVAPVEERVPLQEEVIAEPIESPIPEAAPIEDEQGGVEVTVLDHVTFQPIAGAEVWAFDRSSDQDREFGSAMFNELLDMEALLLRFGERYQADARGVVRLPERSSYLHIGARAKGVFAAHYVFDPPKPTPGQVEHVVLHPLPQVHLKVQVYNATGSPATNQRVEYQAIASGRFGQRREWARTDATGLAEFRNMQRSFSASRGNMTYRVAVPLPGREGVSAPINPLDPPEDVVVLQLPPLGRIIVFVHDQDGTPAADGTYVRVEAIPRDDESTAVGLVNFDSLAGVVRLKTVDGKVEANVQLGQELMAWCTDGASGEITKAYFTCTEDYGQALEVILETG
ncbi:MAG: RNA polymerase sigma-70 factor (ECF subfamily), partial [Planctomycetota bacterium]